MGRDQGNANHPTMHRTVLHKKNSATPNANRAEVQRCLLTPFLSLPQATFCCIWSVLSYIYSKVCIVALLLCMLNVNGMMLKSLKKNVLALYYIGAEKGHVGDSLSSGLDLRVVG